MKSKFTRGDLMKAAIAIVALAALAGIAGSKLAPEAAFSTVMLYSAVGAVVFFAVLTVATILTLTLMQFILRKGGTDTQWFWFSSEPPGLVRIRAETRKYWR